MFTKKGLGLVIAIVLLTTACASSSRTVGTKVDDSAITSRVKSKLAADPEVNPFNIDVDTTNGVVRLTGTVEDQATRQAAVELAERTDGVVRVDNNLQIGERTLGDRLDDAGLVAKIKTLLAADPEINPFNIDVDSENGIVTLSGEVEKRLAKDEAEKIARNCKGVVRVKNLIKVVPDDD